MNGGFPRWQSQYLRKLKVPDFLAMDLTSEDQLIQSYEKKDFDAVNRQVCILYDNLAAMQSSRKITHRHHVKQRQESQLELAFDYAV